MIPRPPVSHVSIFVLLSVSDLLALRTEAEWEEVRQRIGDLPQDEALTAEFSKVLPPVVSCLSNTALLEI